MNKEDLTKEIDKLKASLEVHEDQVKDLQHDLKTAEQRLKDVDKPKLTQKQFAELHRVIESSVENFDFNNTDNYNAEMGMEYDNKVYLECIEFENHADLYEQIIQDVEDLFGVTDEDDEENESKPLSE
tara:strand:+ start:295 stop:678 length:384 start_codon:yes stop_codon:yes gene_type:complete